MQTSRISHILYLAPCSTGWRPFAVFGVRSNMAQQPLAPLQVSILLSVSLQSVRHKACTVPKPETRYNISWFFIHPVRHSWSDSGGGSATVQYLILEPPAVCWRQSHLPALCCPNQAPNQKSTIRSSSNKKTAVFSSSPFLTSPFSW